MVAPRWLAEDQPPPDELDGFVLQHPELDESVVFFALPAAEKQRMLRHVSTLARPR